MKNFYTLRPDLAKTIRAVEDPELFLSIVDLGLLYNITLNENQEIQISLTLTTIGCPLFETIEKDIRAKIETAFPRLACNIKIVFDPPWSLEMMASNARAELGIL